MFKSLVICKRYTFPDNVSQKKLKAFTGIKAEFASFFTETQLNKKRSWRTYLLGFADTYTGLLLPFSSTALPLSGLRKWRNNVILLLALLNEIYWTDRRRKFSSIKAAGTLVLCWVPLKAYRSHVRAAELSQGGAGWLWGGSPVTCLNFSALALHSRDS